MQRHFVHHALQVAFLLGFCGTWAACSSNDNTFTPSSSAQRDGSAVCAIGEQNCAGKCSDTKTDPENCGDCGVVCPVPSHGSATCTAKECGIKCDSGFERCAPSSAGDAGSTDGGTPSGACIDTQTDLGHCGACDTACAKPKNGTVTCEQGSCKITCDQGNTKCGTDCTNLLIDPANCGACGTACGTNEVCAAGTCTVSCPSGQTRCGNACVDTTKDTQNCGGCGQKCTAPTGAVASCTKSQCGAACSTGKLCNGKCVDTNTDKTNCGDCNKVCSSTNGVASCTAGACSIVCNANFDDCDGNVTNGCEALLQSDINNCNTCGHKCTGGQVCSAGACGTVCSSPTTKCDPDGCVNTSSNINHCGDCGTSCKTPPISGAATGAPACTTGSCDVTCQTPTDTKCTISGGVACVNKENDPQACGGCTTHCAKGQKCVAGSCTTDACAPGLVDCGNGCVNTKSNVSFCGGCGSGHTCGALAALCQNGACVGSCSSGLTLCGSALTGGSCVDTTSDPANCGGCGTKCGPGDLCIASKCTDFIYASGCWECGKNNSFGQCCTVGSTSICVSGTACP